MWNVILGYPEPHNRLKILQKYIFWNHNCLPKIALHSILFVFCFEANNFRVWLYISILSPFWQIAFCTINRMPFRKRRQKVLDSINNTAISIQQQAFNLVHFSQEMGLLNGNFRLCGLYWRRSDRPLLAFFLKDTWCTFQIEKHGRSPFFCILNNEFRSINRQQKTGWKCHAVKNREREKRHNGKERNEK